MRNPSILVEMYESFPQKSVQSVRDALVVECSSTLHSETPPSTFLTLEAKSSSNSVKAYVQSSEVSSALTALYLLLHHHTYP